MDLYNNQIDLNVFQNNPGVNESTLVGLILIEIQQGNLMRISNVNYNLPTDQFEDTGGLTPNSALTPTSGNVCD